MRFAFLKMTKAIAEVAKSKTIRLAKDTEGFLAKDAEGDSPR